MLKPWDRVPLGAGPSTPAERSSVAAASPTPESPSRPSRPVSRALCFNPQEWRLVTVEQTEEREIRTWIAVEPIAASGPLDPRLEPVRVVASRVAGVGFCAPEELAGAITRIDAYVWAVRARDARAVPFATLEPLPDYDPGVGEGQVYSAPDSIRSSVRAWQPGRYAIELRGLRRGERSLWFAFRIVPATSARPTETP